MNSFRNLLVWQKAMELTTRVYNSTRTYPSEEKFGLVSQMRRAAVSVPSNIAEGKGRWTDREYTRFLAIARGSLYELVTLVELSEQLEFLEPRDASSLRAACVEVGKMLTGLITTLKKDRNDNHT